MELKKRETIDEKYKWKLDHIFKSEKEWEEACNTILNNINELSKYEGKLGESAENLLKFLNLKIKTSLLFEQVYVYARMNEDENTKDPKKQTLVQKLDPIHLEYSTKLSFFTNEFLEIDEAKLESFYKTNVKTGEEESLETGSLGFYKDYLDEILRGKKHILSKEQEEILAQTSLLYNSQDTFNKLNNADMKYDDLIDKDGNKLPLNSSNYSNYLNDTDQNIRKQAFENKYKAYINVHNTIASTMLGNLKKDKFYSSVRKYGSSLESALFDDNVDVKVYENLIKTVKENVKPLHEYVNLRKELLKLDEMHMYDMYVPVVDGYTEKISYDKAYDMMLEGLSVLGEDYISKLKEARDGGWIDVYPTEGKRTGAYSWGPYGTHPYVLLNHTDDIDSLFTLAHEMGHALHSDHSDSNLHYLYAGYSIFVAEVASTVNEVLLMRHMIDKTEDKEMKIYLINEFIDKFKSTLYRQTQFAEFEKVTHDKVDKGEPLTGQNLNEIYLQLNKDYYGDGVVHDEQIAYEWSRIPHFYNAFYVYQYATGFSAAIAIADKILKEGKPAVDKYIQFLSSGGSDYPIELLKIAGVDMSSPEPIENALKVFEGLVEELKELTK